MQKNLYGEEKSHYEKRVLRIILNLSSTKTLKRMNNTSKKHTFLVYFTVRYQKMKMYVKLLIWGKETTLQETCLLSDYGHVRHQNARKHRKYPIWKTIHHYQLLLFSVFLRNTYLRNKNSSMEKLYNFTKNVNFQSF